MRIPAVLIVGLFYASGAWAVQCTAVFPGSQSFAANGTSSIDNKNACNGTTCSPPPGFTEVSPLPGLSPAGPFNQLTISNGVGEYTSWGLPKASKVTFTGTGTAVLYFSGDVSIPKETEINRNGNPENVVIVVYGNLDIAKKSVVNALIYVAGNAKLEKDIRFKGALSVAGNLDVAKDGTYDFSSSYVTNSNPVNLCTQGTPAPVDHYEIIHDGAGSTCATENITIRACLDASCATLGSDPVSLDLQGNGTTLASATFTGSTTVSVSYTTAGTLSLSVANATIAPDNALVCDSGGGSSCDMVYSSAGCAGSCASYFADTIQGQGSSSEIKFKNNGQVIGDPDNILNFANLNDQSSGASNTCNTVDCSITNSFAPSLSLPAFQTGTTTADILLSSGTTTIGPGGDFNQTDIDVLAINGSANVTFLASSVPYTISSASFTGSPVITFNAGEYWFDFLEILDSTTIIVNGPVTIYVNQHFDIENNSQVNAGGLAKDLVFVAYDRMHLKDNVVVNAVIYSVGSELEIRDSAGFTGAISAAGKVEIKDNGVVNYQDVTGVQVGSLCGASVPSVDHYEIIHDGAGLTCEAESITIRACMDSVCTSLSTDSISLDFQANGTTVSSPVFTGSTVVSLSQTTPATLALSIANPSITPDAGLVCNDGSGTSCNIDFVTAGFRFLYGASNAVTIGNQVAGTAFGQDLKLQAVQDNNGVCTGLFTGNVSVELAQQSISPGTVSTLDFTVGGNAIAKNSSAGVSSYTSVDLNFGSNSIAIIPTPVYEDAGQIQLHARYNVGGVSLSGNSNSFWVAPAGLLVSASTAGTPLDASLPTALPVQGAGVGFDLVVTAINALGATTPGYAPGQIQFRLQRTGPTTAGADGAFIYAAGASLTSALSPVFQNVSLTAFTGGVSSFGAAGFSEAGLVNLDLQDVDYGNAGILVNGAAIDIGRFVPDHFVVTVAAAGSFMNACTLGPGSFTWVGESFGYLVAPSFTISPMNAGGTVTRNYQGSFMHLTAAEISLSFPVSDATNALAVSSVTSAGLLTENGDGNLTYVLALLDQYTYDRAGVTEIAPFSSDLDIAVTAITETLDSVVATGMPVTLTPSPVSLRFGRLRADNAFGSEIEPLPVPVRTEYFTASGNYQINPDDFCTDPVAVLSTVPDSSPSGSHINIPVGGGVSTLSSNSPVMAGSGDFVFSAPGEGNTGDIDLGFNLGSLGWLQYDWDGDGVLDSTLNATVTFGQYRGHDRVIYWQETTQ